MSDHNYDFLHFLQDTLSLLGAPIEIRSLIEKVMDSSVSEQDVEGLRSYNIKLITLTKDRLAHLHTIKIIKEDRDDN